MTLGIELRSIRKTFDEFVALNAVSLAAEPGEFVSILGPSGCGKSTLLRVLAGLTPADAGSIHIAGEPVNAVPPKDRGVAFVFQNYALYPHLSAAGNIAAPLVNQELTAFERLPGVTRLSKSARARHESIQRRVRNTAQMLQIEELLDRRPIEMSGGQRQRVALGRALIREPRAFLLDEPLANLDANLRTHMRSEIAAIQKRLGVTTLFVTHDQMEALALSDRIAVMFDGEIRQFATPDELYRRPADLDVAAFFSHPRLNSLSAQADGGGYVTVADRRIKLVHARGCCGKGVLAFRAEDASLAKAGVDDALPVIVDRVEHAGADMHVFARLLPQGDSIVLRVPSQNIGLLHENEKHAVVVDVERAWFFSEDRQQATRSREAAA